MNKYRDEQMCCALCERDKEKMLDETGVALLARNSDTGKAICVECFDAIAPAMIKAKIDNDLMDGSMAIPLGTGSLKEALGKLKTAISAVAEGKSNAVEGDDCECPSCTMRRAMQGLAEKNGMAEDGPQPGTKIH